MGKTKQSRVRGQKFEVFGTSNFVLCAKSILFVNDFSTRSIRTLGSPGKRDFAEDGIAIPGHKPIQQIANGLNEWKAQEN
jgi:hypothetical protein